MRFVIILLLFISMPVFAAPITDMPERLKDFTSNINNVTASFKQIKILPESTKKFISGGNVKFEKDVGFIWIQNTPQKQTFVSTKDKYCIDGVAQDLNSLPYFNYVRRIIDDVLSGDISGLSTVFNVDYSEYGKNQWQLTATPRFEAVSTFLQDMVMYGTTSDLTKVIITYQNGTIIIINFNKTSVVIQDDIVC